MTSSSAQAEILRRLAAHAPKRVGGHALYWLCAETLRLAIEELHYPPAVPLPSEKDMAQALGVSRPTLRQAMSKLSDDGVIHTQRGIGTFALHGGLVRSMGLNSLYTDLLRERRRPSTRVVEMKQVRADAATAAGLQVPIGTWLQHVGRVRFADGVPIVLIRSQLLLPDGIELSQDQLETDGLYNLLHQFADIELVGGNQTISARLVRPDEADFLELPTISAVMVAQRYAFDAGGHGVESSTIVYSEGTTIFTADLRGTSVQAGGEAESTSPFALRL